MSRYLYIQDSLLGFFKITIYKMSIEVDIGDIAEVSFITVEVPSRLEWDQLFYACENFHSHKTCIFSYTCWDRKEIKMELKVEIGTNRTKDVPEKITWKL